MYVNGRDGTSAQMAALDACDGAVLALVDLQDPQLLSGAVVSAMTLDGPDLIVTGTQGNNPADNPQAFFARLSRPDLSQRWLQPLFGGPNGSEGWDVTLDVDGSVYVLGATSDPSFWVVRGDDAGHACGWTPASPGAGRAAATGFASVWLAGTIGNQIALQAYQGWCDPQVICACPPVLDVRADLPDAAYGEARALAIGPNHVYVAGATNGPFADNNFRGVLLVENGANPLATLTSWDPTPDMDAFMGVAIAGNRAYVAADAGMASIDAGFDDGVQGHLLVIDLDSGNVDADYPLGAGLARGVALDGDTVTVVLGHEASTDVIRCPMAGPCP